MASCIGRICGRPGDWFAELDFDNAEAIVKERGSGVDVATMPLGEWSPETDAHYAALSPDCLQAQRLMRVVFANDAWSLLVSIRDDIKDRYPNTQEQPGEVPMWAESIVEQIEQTLELLKVPNDNE